MKNTRVTCELAAEALDSMDDFARMDFGVDPFGPRGVLERFISEVRQERKETWAEWKSRNNV